MSPAPLTQLLLELHANRVELSFASVNAILGLATVDNFLGEHSADRLVTLLGGFLQ